MEASWICLINVFIRAPLLKSDPTKKKCIWIPLKKKAPDPGFLPRKKNSDQLILKERKEITGPRIKEVEITRS